MKTIDKTPFLDEKGNLGLTQRIQGILQFGFNWPRELEAQSAIIKFFERQLEKGFVAIRNMTLGQSGITIPIILLGPTGIYVIEVALLRGRYQASGESWNVEAGDQYKPAPVNIIKKTMRMARALQAYIERQGAQVPDGIEPVIIAGDPGLHIESVRPAIRVMMIDGIKSFASGLAVGRQVLSHEQVHDFTDRILNPRVQREPVAPVSAAPAPQQDYQQPYEEASRARAIFDASKDVKPFNPSDFGFAMGQEDEETSMQDIPPVPREPVTVEPVVRQPKPRQKLIMGMTSAQLAVIGALALTLIGILAVFAYIALF